MNTTTNRKRIIGLCITRLQDDNSMKNLEYIHKLAKENDYKVITFYPYLEWYEGMEDSNVNSLYMANFDMLDALIIDMDMITSMGFVRKIVKLAREKNVITVTINGMCEGAIGVVSTVERTFEKVVKHVVEDHKCKKVDLIAGFKNRWNTENLIDIYKTVLRENGIEYDESRVGYGEYYGDKARNVIKEFLDYDTPDAIICANDEMAFIACQLIKERGLNVPKDIIVTGIDGCLKSRLRRPLLTTCRKKPEEICDKAFEIIKDKFAGKNALKVYNVEADPVFSESCGCVTDVDLDCTEELDWLYAQKEYGYVAQSQLYMLTEKMIQASQINDIANVLLEGLPANAFFCVKDSFMQDIFQEDTVARVPDANDKFYIIADSREKSHAWQSFLLKDLFPEDDDILDSEYPIIITPIHYQKAQFGYIVLNSDNYKIEASVLERYIMNFNSTIGRYVGDRKLRFVNSELFHVNESIKQIKERDLLTGMFNSRGFLRELEYLKEKCIINNEKLILVCVDLDGLGKLNDIYGHSEGDVAIQTLSKILQDSVGREDVCTHLGSDEFVVAMRVKSEPEDVISTYFLALDGRVENYNAVSGKEYSLEINKTYLSVKPVADMDMKAVLDEALSRKRMIKQNHRSVSSRDSMLGEDINSEEYRLVQSIINDNKFKYAFQPIVNASNGEIVAYEALMRTDTEKFVSPLTVLKYASLDERLYEIEYATFFNIFEQIQKHTEELKGKKVFLNSIPGCQLNDTDYAKLRRKYKNLFGNVVVEITEQTEMDDDALAVIRKRSETDEFEVAIDDYGTGYSNTASLLRYLPNYVKIDRLLITDVHEDPKKQHFVNNIIEFAHDNGFLALAEGVETVDELTAVIHMGVDLIQGFYTAKPSFEFITDIAESVRDDITSANLITKDTARRKVYVADNEEEIFLVRLALENYTCLIVSQPEITIVGNADYPAEIQIKVKDCSKTTIHLQNVSLVSDSETPCIDIGANSDVTLVVEDSNYLSGIGIRVPENASLTIAGEFKSELHLTVDGEKSYGIGNDWDSAVGQIEMTSDGLLDIKTKGTYAIAIGGGTYRHGRGIGIMRGKVTIDLAGANSVGIGSVLGRIPTVITECSVIIDIKAYSSVGIGTWNGEQDIDISNALVDIGGSGNTVCAIGSFEGCNGSIRINSAHVTAKCNGCTILLLGNQANGVDVSISKARIDLHGEGNAVLGVGSYDMNGMISIVDSMINMIIKASTPIPFGAREDNCRISEVVKSIQIND